jgi:biotin synthase-related radical SAM superfamily protein
MDKKDILDLKAKLLEIGRIYVPNSFLCAELISRSVAGPSAGRKAIFISFLGTQVRLTLDHGSPLRLKEKNNTLAIFLRNKLIVDNVKIVAPTIHCPNQIYITIESRCIFDCKFCMLPKLKLPSKTEDEIRNMILNCRNKGFRSVAFTSGVTHNGIEIRKCANLVRWVKKNFKVSVGVSIYPQGQDDLDTLYNAGVDEFKLNIEVIDENLFNKVCPGRSQKHIIDNLLYAVKLFGKNAVTTNILLGLGQSDTIIKKGIIFFAKKGIIPILRPLAIIPERKEDLYFVTGGKAARPPKERILKLSFYLKKVLDKYNLNTLKLKTMCHPCKGCEIVPHYEF